MRSLAVALAVAALTACGTAPAGSDATEARAVSAGEPAPADPVAPTTAPPPPTPTTLAVAVVPPTTVAGGAPSPEPAVVVEGGAPDGPWRVVAGGLPPDHMPFAFYASDVLVGDADGVAAWADANLQWVTRRLIGVGEVVFGQVPRGTDRVVLTFTDGTTQDAALGTRAGHPWDYFGAVQPTGKRLFSITAQRHGAEVCRLGDAKQLLAWPDDGTSGGGTFGVDCSA